MRRTSTCKLPGPELPTTGRVLGVELEGADLDAQFATAAAHTSEVQATLAELEDARAELALLRVSANASRVVHLLRAAGPEIDAAALDDFDRRQRLALGGILGGPLADQVWEQAAAPACTQPHGPDWRSC